MTRRVIVKERDVSPRNELTSITSSLRMRCPIDTPLETSTSAQISFEQALDGVKRKDEPSFSASLWVTNVKCQIAIRTLCRFSSSIPCSELRGRSYSQDGSTHFSPSNVSDLFSNSFIQSHLSHVSGKN